ncbi:ROK family transcriptional regulator [Enemella evansiae]|uniref:ROK family transcriptional regulator n=1 Tax=Enemella evansiae TaxID=2016499 RepID=UPI00105EF019|nr:ROK family transcriptional regulator [Enemella evansiae]TDO93168.1 putative NBD/HSP70 family sugar kinase [Enemella evansiae]
MGERGIEPRGAASCGALLQEIREADGITRQDLLQVTGMSRSTLYQRLDLLERAGLIHEAGQESSSGGRPPKLVRFDDRDRLVLTLDVGQTRATVSVCRLDGTVLAGTEVTLEHPGPAELLARLSSVADPLLAEQSGRLIGVGLGIPAPVQAPGDVRWPTVAMPDAGYPLVDDLVRRFKVPTCVENDARVLTLGEYAAAGGRDGIFLGIKYASGLGAGVVTHGQMLRGSIGATGDIGHLRLSDGGPLCTCGNHGCLAAYTSGNALLRDLSGRVDTLTDAIELLDAGDPEVTEWFDTAIRTFGHTLAGLVQTLNPDEVVFGGYLGRHPWISDRLATAIRDFTLHRVNENTVLRPGSQGALAGTLGLVWLVNKTVYAPERVNALIADLP